MRASEGAEHPTELTRDHLRLRDQLLALEPSARPADTTRALARAAQLLGGVEPRAQDRVPDLAAREDRASRRRAAVGQGRSDARRRSICGPPKLPNLAVTALRVDPDPGAGTRGVAFDAEVGNFSDAPAKVELSLAIADRVVARGALELGPASSKTKRFLATLPPGTRATDASVSLAGDALAIDDRRWVRATLRDEVRVLLVDGDPRTVRHDDELFYLEAALRPGDREDSGTSVRSITAEELAGIEPKAHAARAAPAIDLDDFDVVVLANVAALPAERVAMLADWVRARRRHPRRARRSRRSRRVRPHDAAADAAEPARSDRHDVGRVARGARQPRAPPREVGGRSPDLRAVLQGRARARRREVLQDLAARPDDRDRRSQGARAVHERRRRAGRGVDRRRPHAAVHVDARSRLERPADPPRLPAAAPAGGAPPRAQARARSATPITSSAARSCCRPATSRSSRSAARTASARCSRAIASPAAARVRFGSTDRPGVYRVIGTDQTGATHERDELAFVVNVDPRGSDLDAGARQRAAGVGHRRRRARPATTRRRVELWHALAAVVLLLLLAEGVLVQR